MAKVELPKSDLVTILTGRLLNFSADLTADQAKEVAAQLIDSNAVTAQTLFGSPVAPRKRNRKPQVAEAAT